MKEQAITFASGSLTLEGLMARPEGLTEVRGAVVCHPHPLYGGSMYNNVVDAALDAMWRRGWATLRFNFRGVGRSQGEHDGGAGEAADVAAAVGYLAAQAGIGASAVVLAGYSFGAIAAATAAPTIRGLGALLLIAYPLRMSDAAALKLFDRPILLAAGDQDSYCPAAQLEALHEDLGERGQIRIVVGADHFFGGCEVELADAIDSMLAAI